MNNQSNDISWIQKIWISLILLICGVLVFVFGANWHSAFPTNTSQVYRAVLALIFLSAAIIMRRTESMKHYSQIAYAFFIAIFAFFMTSLTIDIRTKVLSPFRSAMGGTARMSALEKVFESVLVVLVILVLYKLWGGGFGSLYIKKGRLGLGLFIGFCLMTINTATGVVTGVTMGHAGEIIIARFPWVFLYSLANSVMEELWFRGLFLRQFISLIGTTGTIIVTSLVFTVAHSVASYMTPIQVIIFQVIIFPMALLLAFLMHKSEGIWGSILYHTGSDVFIYYLLDL